MERLHQEGVSPTLPKDSFNVHETHTVSKNIYYFLLCLLPMQKQPHLPLATLGLLSSPSVTTSLYTILQKLSP